LVSTLQVVKDPEDTQAWRDQVAEVKAEKFGWTAFKFLSCGGFDARLSDS
jgi:hypothetical protein